RVRDLAGDEGEVELARLQERNVLAASLGIARLHLKQGILPVDHFGERVAVEREAATRGGGAEDEHDRNLLRWRNFTGAGCSLPARPCDTSRSRCARSARTPRASSARAGYRAG